MNQIAASNVDVGLVALFLLLSSLGFVLIIDAAVNDSSLLLVAWTAEKRFAIWTCLQGLESWTLTLVVKGHNVPQPNRDLTFNRINVMIDSTDSD